MSIIKPKVEVKPVAWTGSIVTKYQGFVTVTRVDGEVRVMTGDPMPSKNEAFRELKTELRRRLVDIRDAQEALSDYVFESAEAV